VTAIFDLKEGDIGSNRTWGEQRMGATYSYPIISASDLNQRGGGVHTSGFRESKGWQKDEWVVNRKKAAEQQPGGGQDTPGPRGEKKMSKTRRNQDGQKNQNPIFLKRIGVALYWKGKVQRRWKKKRELVGGSGGKADVKKVSIPHEIFYKERKNAKKSRKGSKRTGGKKGTSPSPGHLKKRMKAKRGKRGRRNLRAGLPRKKKEKGCDVGNSAPGLHGNTNDRAKKGKVGELTGRNKSSGPIKRPDRNGGGRNQVECTVLRKKRTGWEGELEGRKRDSAIHPIQCVKKRRPACPRTEREKKSSTRSLISVVGKKPGSGVKR